MLFGLQATGSMSDAQQTDLPTELFGWSETVLSPPTLPQVWLVPPKPRVSHCHSEAPRSNSIDPEAASADLPLAAKTSNNLLVRYRPAPKSKAYCYGTNLVLDDSKMVALAARRQSKKAAIARAADLQRRIAAEHYNDPFTKLPNELLREIAHHVYGKEGDDLSLAAFTLSSKHMMTQLGQGAFIPFSTSYPSLLFPYPGSKETRGSNRFNLFWDKKYQKWLRNQGEERGGVKWIFRLEKRRSQAAWWQRRRMEWLELLVEGMGRGWVACHECEVLHRGEACVRVKLECEQGEVEEVEEVGEVMEDEGSEKTVMSPVSSESEGEEEEDQTEEE